MELYSSTRSLERNGSAVHYMSREIQTYANAWRKVSPKSVRTDQTGLPTMPVQSGATHATLAIVNALRDEML